MRLKSTPRNGLLRQQELAELFGTTPQTIIAWEREGMKPVYRHGNYVLFDPAACMKWLYHERKDGKTMPNKWQKSRGKNGK